MRVLGAAALSLPPLLLLRPQIRRRIHACAHTGEISFLILSVKTTGQGMLDVVLPLVVGVRGTILAFPCAFKKGAF